MRSTTVRHSAVLASAVALTLSLHSGCGTSDDQKPWRTAGAGGGSSDGAGGAAPTGMLTWDADGSPVGLWLPEPTGAPPPVVMYLHSCGNPTVDEDFWLIGALQAVEPCAVLLPTRPAAESTECAAWGGTFDSAPRPGLLAAVAALDEVIEEYGLDATRQYLHGESMGAEGVFRLLVDHPGRFAGAVAVAGYTLDTGADAMAETPLWIFHGAADTISDVDAVRTIYASIVSAGGADVRYTEYEALGHVPAIDRARTEPGLLEWLLAQRR